MLLPLLTLMAGVLRISLKKAPDDNPQEPSRPRDRLSARCVGGRSPCGKGGRTWTAIGWRDGFSDNRGVRILEGLGALTREVAWNDTVMDCYPMVDPQTRYSLVYT